MKYRKLTPEEEAVIVHRGTERPFTGEYCRFDGQGTYACRRCGAPLFRSDDKFDARCGWPSFDDEIAGAVRKAPDADGFRTEILCARCGAHLGHVFNGEGFTDKNTRHCVNSLSLDFVPAADDRPIERALFASGCFWGTEYHFRQAKGVLATAAGYTGGWKDNPTYEEVCGGATGHAEALEVLFDPHETTYEELARLFFETHDPAQLDRQGPDIGSQYRSAIFYVSDEQKHVAEKLIGILRQKGINVVTEVKPATTFWKAEDYHQDYYGNRGGVPYCHSHVRRF